MTEATNENFLVLMVDDSEDDCLLLKMALSRTSRLRFIGSLSDGEELISYLSGHGKYADREKFPLPDMLLLDLMMPRKNGFEVLEWLREQPFEEMVVVVLSGSDQAQDIQRAMALGADYFHTKEGSPVKRLELVKTLEEYLTNEVRS